MNDRFFLRLMECFEPGRLRYLGQLSGLRFVLDRRWNFELTIWTNMGLLQFGPLVVLW